MMELIYVLAFVCASVLTGLISSQLAKGLDFGMDYGHLLDFVRLNRVKKAAYKTDQKGVFDIAVKEFSKIDDFHKRMDAFDKLYWQIAGKAHSLTLWICATCLSHRINFYFSSVLIIGYWIGMGVSFDILGILKVILVSLGFYLLSFSFNQIFIR